MKGAKLIILVDPHRQKMETGEATWQSYVIEWNYRRDGTCRSYESNNWDEVVKWFNHYLLNIPKPEVMFVD